ncbi:MAG TPA: prepilin-type N-terminal cleavage/methylation domain-containing protein [Gemmatimonadaceae bacterium]|nr:prepilin-type N-terminal cleavage/methylation domain-containing protein [Gemmatimonadaceae bacterium]
MTIAMRARKGLTLIETLIALAILTGAMLGMGTFVSRLSHGAGTGYELSMAGDLAVARVEQIKAYPVYASLEATFVGTETGIAGYPGFTRRTYIARTSTSRADYKTVTVVVTAAQLASPMKKTSVIAAF